MSSSAKTQVSEFLKLQCLFDEKTENPTCMNCYSPDNLTHCDCDHAIVCDDCYDETSLLKFCDICDNYHVCESCSFTTEVNYQNEWDHGTYSDIRSSTFGYKCFFEKLIIVFSKIKNGKDWRDNRIEALENISNDMDWSNLEWDCEDNLGYVKNYIQDGNRSLTFDLIMNVLANKELAASNSLD